MADVSYTDAVKANLGTASAYVGKAIGAGISIYEAAQGNTPEIGPSVMYGSFQLGMTTMYGLNTLKSMRNTAKRLDSPEEDMDAIQKSLSIHSTYCKRAGVLAAAQKKGLEEQVEEVFEEEDISKHPSTTDIVISTCISGANASGLYAGLQLLP
jgi:hypothetical protein